MSRDVLSRCPAAENETLLVRLRQKNGVIIRVPEEELSWSSLDSIGTVQRVFLCIRLFFIVVKATSRGRGEGLLAIRVS